MVKQKKTILFVLIVFFSKVILGSQIPEISLKQELQELYKDISGFGISNDESKMIEEQGGSSVYGEITYDSAKKLLDFLKLSNKDVFYDLGSGVGKFVIQTFLSTPVKKSIGIELSEERHNQAKKVCDILHKKKKVAKGRILSFKNKNILDVDLKDATVIFMCSTCFPKKLMQDLTKKFSTLQKGLRVLTLKRLPDNEWFKLVKKESFPMTWSSSSPVYFYEFKKD